jgi:surfeit locus 1 family protein
MLGVLLGLGFWQVRRLHWKEGLLERLHNAELAAPTPLPEQPDQFQKVWVSGMFKPGIAVRYAAETRDLPDGRVEGHYLGSHLLMVLDRAGKAPLLVDRGWVRSDRPLPPVPGGVVRVEGYVHPGARSNWMSPSDMVAQRWFFTLNPARIGAVIGIAGLAPYVLTEMGDRDTPPIPAAHLPEPPNNHLSYAVTWFSFAVILIAIYFLWLSETLRKKSSRERVEIGPR